MYRVCVPLALFTLLLPCAAQQAPVWKKQIDLAGHFEIKLPQYATKPDLELHNPPPREYDVRLYTVRSPDKPVMWAVGYVDYQKLPHLKPEEFVEDMFLQSFGNSGAQQSGLTSINVWADTLEFPGVRFNYQGKKFQFEDINVVNATAEDMMNNRGPAASDVPGPDQRVSGEMFLVNHRLFILLTLARPGDRNESETRNFFASFRVFNTYMIR